MLYVFCSSSFYFLKTFFPFFEKQKVPKTVQFLLIVYKICYFHIQLTANIEHKPKNQHAKTCRLVILDFTVKGFAL